MHFVTKDINHNHAVQLILVYQQFKITLQWKYRTCTNVKSYNIIIQKLIRHLPNYQWNFKKNNKQQYSIFRIGLMCVGDFWNFFIVVIMLIILCFIVTGLKFTSKLLGWGWGNIEAFWITGQKKWYKG